MLYNVFKTQVLTCGDQCVFRVFIATGKLNWIIRTADEDTKERGFVDFLGH